MSGGNEGRHLNGVLQAEGMPFAQFFQAGAEAVEKTQTSWSLNWPSIPHFSFSNSLLMASIFGQLGSSVCSNTFKRRIQLVPPMVLTDWLGFCLISLPGPKLNA